MSAQLSPALIEINFEYIITQTATARKRLNTSSIL